ncbi:MAG: carbon-nitrogen family hydrolase, partial [Mailhella sp.]|nr:carbon-nitrogen family hydrolase [Mailhella sp.]
DKVHLFRLMDEDTFLAPGRQVSLFELHGMPCSPVICYDIRFCELPRRLAVQGAELLFVSAEWPSPRAEHWRTLLRARAIENQIFVAACNRCGVTDGTVFAGRSAIIAPDGSVLAEAGTGEEIIWADIDANAVRHMRDLIPVFEDRVPGMY